MRKRKAGLGRGLNALLGDPDLINAVTPDPPEKTLVELDIDLIQQSSHQPRRHMDQIALQELADSIAKQGVIQPIVVRQIAEGRYEIVAGERRWRAAQLAGLRQLPVVIKAVSDESALAIALIENIQREDLNPAEQARGMQRLMDNFSLTQQQVGELLGKSRPTVANLLRLLKLDSEVVGLLEQGDLEMGHARALLALEQLKQRQLAKIIIAKQLSVRQTEKLVRQRQAKIKVVQVNNQPDPNLLALQTQISEKLGAKVDLHHKQGGKGKLVIYYHSVDELEGILARIE